MFLLVGNIRIKITTIASENIETIVDNYVSCNNSRDTLVEVVVNNIGGTKRVGNKRTKI